MIPTIEQILESFKAYNLILLDFWHIQLKER